MKFLSPKVHGYIDYASAAMLLLAPTLFGFGGVAAGLCYVLFALHTAMSLLTAYPLGVAKIIPFPVHGAIELGAALLLLAGPFLFGFTDVPAARNFFWVSGVALVGVFAVTNYRAAERPQRLGAAWHRDRRIV